MGNDVPPQWREIKQGAATNPVLQKVLDRHRSGWTKEQALLEAVLRPTTINIEMGPVTIKAADIEKLAAAVEPMYQKSIPPEQWAPGVGETFSTQVETFEDAQRVVADSPITGAGYVLTNVDTDEVIAEIAPLSTESTEAVSSCIHGVSRRRKPAFPPNRIIKEGSDPTCAGEAHADPDNTGKCIHCGAVLDGSAG